MRILHTSDWHLGRSFHRADLLPAQAMVLDHLVETVRAERVDAVVIAGDVYDRALPGVEAVRLLSETLSRLRDAGAVVVVSSGNHDSPHRLGFGADLLDRAGVHVRTDPARAHVPVLLEDEHGPVAVYPVPYLEPVLVADQLGCGRSHPEVLRAVLTAARADLGTRPAGTRSVVAAHAFVGGGQACDSERELAVGGLGQVPAADFAGFDYVALGHLHGRQRLTGTVRYSGSPLAFSFSEAAHTKGSWLVHLGRSGVEVVEAVDSPVVRPLARLRGPLAELLTDPGHAVAEKAWCQITVTDDERPAAPMERLRARFPHVVELRFAPAAQVRSGSYTERLAGVGDVEVCCGFLEHVRGRSPSVAEERLVREAVETVLIEEVAESPRTAGRSAATGRTHDHERAAG